MRHNTQNFTQVQTVFGAGYVPDTHGDDTQSYLPPAEKHEFAVDLDAVIKGLRAALSLR